MMLLGNLKGDDRGNIRMAPSDGKEASRLERYASIAIPIVLRCIAQKKIAS